MKKTLLTILIILIIVFLLALPKLGWFSQNQKEPVGAGAGPRPGAGRLQVEAIIIQPARFDNKLNVTGSVLANESLELKSEISGQVTQIAFREGKSVKQGELLLRMDDEELRAQLLKAKYNQKLNQDNEVRQRKLLQKEAISQEEYDNSLNRLNTSLADVKVLEAQLAKTRIEAPFEGVIGLRYISQGAYISPNTVIATLYNINPAKIEFTVPSRYSAQVQPGLMVRFTVENDTSAYDGTVYAVEPRIDPETRTLRIRAMAENSQNRLLPGQFVKVELVLRTVTDAILVPTEAVVPELSGHKVFVKRGPKAREIRVETGIRTSRELEILSGLKTGDTLVTTGILQLRDGLDIAVSKVN
jgi:membrane fusion protein (multidrug efflux system)